jgi:hypothetical protein
LRVRDGSAEFERLDASWCTATGFKELLEVPWNIAHNLERFFRHRAHHSGHIADVTGMTPELLMRFEKHFKIPSV